MNTPLHDALDDLVTHVPRSVVPPDLAERAYGAARARRTRQRVVALLGAVAALLVALTVVGPAMSIDPVAPAGREATVDGYPQRIDAHWWVRDLPGRPGPVAALLQLRGSDEKPETMLAWYAVAPDGRRWRLGRNSADIYPTVSADGTRVGFIGGNDEPYVVHDLVSGRRTEFPDVGAGFMTPEQPVPQTEYAVPGQFPSFWSPDGRRLLVHGILVNEQDGGDRGLVLDSEGGGVTVLSRGAFLAGWASDDSVAVLDVKQMSGDGGALEWIDVRVIGLDDTVRRTVRLRPVAPWGGVESASGWGSFRPSQWSASVTPDRQHIVLYDDNTGEGRLMRLSDGAEVEAWEVTGQASACGVTAYTGGVVVSRSEEQILSALDVSGAEPARTVVSPRLGGRCLVWATDALAGEARGGQLFGTSTQAWTWWWRELLLGAMAMAMAVAVVVRRRRRVRWQDR